MSGEDIGRNERSEQQGGRDLPRWFGLLLAGVVFTALSWSAAANQSPGLALLLGLVGGTSLLIACIACGVQLGIESARGSSSRR